MSMENSGKLKNLIDAFSGRAVSAPVTEYPQVPFEQMVETLSGISDAIWGMYAFAREPLEGKISFAQKQKYIQDSNACGREWAEKVKQQYQTADARAIAKCMGMDVKKVEKPIGGSIVLFAQYVRPNEITIFTDCIKRPVGERKKSGSSQSELLEEKMLESVLLSHELFHAVEEENQDSIYTHTEKIELWRKPFSNRSKIACLSEIAAMAFAKELNGLAFSPYMLDVLLVYFYDKNAAYGLFEEVRSIQKELNQRKD